MIVPLLEPVWANIHEEKSKMNIASTPEKTTKKPKDIEKKVDPKKQSEKKEIKEIK